MYRGIPQGRWKFQPCPPNFQGVSPAGCRTIGRVLTSPPRRASKPGRMAGEQRGWGPMVSTRRTMKVQVTEDHASIESARATAIAADRAKIEGVLEGSGACIEAAVQHPIRCGPGRPSRRLTPSAGTATMSSLDSNRSPTGKMASTSRRESSPPSCWAAPTGPDAPLSGRGLGLADGREGLAFQEWSRPPLLRDHRAWRPRGHARRSRRSSLPGA